jgi:hypothetical protein
MVDIGKLNALLNSIGELGRGGRIEREIRTIRSVISKKDGIYKVTDKTGFESFKKEMILFKSIIVDFRTELNSINQKFFSQTEKKLLGETLGRLGLLFKSIEKIIKDINAKNHGALYEYDDKNGIEQLEGALRNALGPLRRCVAAVQPKTIKIKLVGPGSFQGDIGDLAGSMAKEHKIRPRKSGYGVALISSIVMMLSAIGCATTGVRVPNNADIPEWAFDANKIFQSMTKGEQENFVSNGGATSWIDVNSGVLNVFTAKKRTSGMPDHLLIEQGIFNVRRAYARMLGKNTRVYSRSNRNARVTFVTTRRVAGVVNVEYHISKNFIYFHAYQSMSEEELNSARDKLENLSGRSQQALREGNRQSQQRGRQQGGYRPGPRRVNTRGR